MNSIEYNKHGDKTPQIKTEHRILTTRWLVKHSLKTFSSDLVLTFR